MPGIFGVVDLSPDQSDRHAHENRDLVERMSAAMTYEVEYRSDFLLRPSLGVWAGYVGFPQPLEYRHAESTDAKIVAMTTGHPVADMHCSTAGELLQAYERGATRALEKTSGRVAGFVVDERRGSVVLFNDRYGVERVFIHTDGSRTFFASEAKAILAVAPRTRVFDPIGLAELLACGCTLGTRSLFKDIQVLTGGTVLTFERGGAPKSSRYFTSEHLESVEPAAKGEFLDGFSASLARAVNESYQGVGVSLTGGLDSRMIMASLQAPPGSIPCYTFGSSYRTTGDVAVGRQVAAQCGQPHHVLELGHEFLRNARSTLEHAVYVSDGYIGLSGAAELHLNRRARTLAPVRMTGNWGGELMRGVRAFKHIVPKGEFLRPAMLQQISMSAETFRGATPSNTLSFALFQQMPFQGYGRYVVERSQIQMQAPFLANDVVTWLYRAPAAFRASTECATALIERRPGLLKIPTDTGRLGPGPAPRAFARRTYRRAMVKAEYLASHGAPDWLARLLASGPGRLIETSFMGRDKFQHFRLWIRDQIADVVRDILLQDSNGDLENWFDMQRVAEMVDAHVAGHANFTSEIDSLLTVALAQRLLLRRSSLPTTSDSVTRRVSYV